MGRCLGGHSAHVRTSSRASQGAERDEPRTCGLASLWGGQHPCMGASGPGPLWFE
jgi:hypothetical protein